VELGRICGVKNARKVFWGRVKNGFCKKVVRSTKGINVIFLLHSRKKHAIFFPSFRNSPERKSRKTMKKSNSLKLLAVEFINALLPVEKLKIRLKVQDKLESINSNLSYSKLLSKLGLSYIANCDSSSKLVKGKKFEFATLGLYLAPANKSGRNVCTFAGSCKAPCLDESGRVLMEKRGGKQTIQVARLLKTWLHEFREDLFNKAICHEIKREAKLAKKKGIKFCVRLNCTSDIDFSDIIASFPEVQFYDYTKDPNRQSMDNYHLTYSWDSFSKGRLPFYRQALERGQKIAFPVVKADLARILELPSTLEMDSSDLRFLDSDGHYGILAIKETGNTQQGIRDGFMLDFDGFKKAVAWIEG